MSPRKSHPKGINPANPNRNFVEMCYQNKGQSDEYRDYLYGNIEDASMFPFRDQPSKKASGFGHGVERRQGCLRMSGTKGAHRIGKR